VHTDDAFLHALARRFPTREAALAEMAHLQSVLALPKGTVHVVSDVHGEDKKLSHIIRNASGGLRALVDDLFGSTLTPEERRELLSLVYYVRETWVHLGVSELGEAERAAFLASRLARMLELVRALGGHHTARALERVFPHPYEELFRELLLDSARAVRREGGFREALLRPFVARRQELDVLRLASRIVRNLSVHELVVAGDLGDRGPRLDRVIDILMKQPNVSIVWGNHDVLWMGACLGHEALIATVVRVSLRYRRLSQLEEGYGITMAPVEKLARDVYGEDPAERFGVKGEGLRDPLLMARMQKAMAILQFKLEAQAAARNPEMELEHRSLLRAIDRDRGTVTIDGKVHPLRDTSFPTVDPSAPDALSPDEQRCIDRLKQSFLASPQLWAHMQFLRGRGAMMLTRDHNLIFHGCVPVDDQGALLSFPIDGEPRAGRALFAGFERVVHRAFREKRPKDLDLLWYLWTGKHSPLFGKDRMATFEGYLVADEQAKKENKNPYFKLQNDAAFCDRVFAELGADPSVGFIVNGHVPVKLEKGDEPLKKSGKAVTIDGAFSEAYGDRGYTLILDAHRTALAEHHHFDSIAAAVAAGADIVPRVTDLRRFDRQRLVADTETGARIRGELAALEELIRAYEDNRLLEKS
jgi:fructose-1,6-bisphosphatase III